MTRVNTITSKNRFLSGKSVLRVCTLPDRGVFQLRDQHPAAPGHQVSLCGHLAARGVAVHLTDSLDLPAATQTHIGRRVHLCWRTHRS